MIDSVDPRTPVLVGIGPIEQRQDDPSMASDALALMVQAVRAAGQDSGRPELLQRVNVIAVPKGRWRYEDPGRHIATSLGSHNCESILALVGILQQSLIGECCQRIADGVADVAVVVGGEASYRRLRGNILGVPTPETIAPGIPATTLRPKADLVLQAEIDSGLGRMPVGFYAIIESARRYRRGLGVDEHRTEIADMYHRFSSIAANNPRAWRRTLVSADEIRNPSQRNPMLAFPYTKLHNSTWNVDQAAALLFCTARLAEEIGVPRSKWIFPLASTESNYMTALTERADLSTCPGARLAGRRALAIGGLEVNDLDFVELYSCFPAAVQIYAEELGVDPELDWTVTGGMPFAGGPFNSYVLQSTCRMVELMRDRPTAVGLVSSVSGVLTKQGFGLWSTGPRPNPFAWEDVSTDVERSVRKLPVDTARNCAGTVAGYTVVYAEGTRRAVAVIDTAAGSRTLASTCDTTTIERFESGECCGRRTRILEGELSLEE